MGDQSRGGDTEAGPEYADYLESLRTNRNFTAPVVAAAVEAIALGLPDGPPRLLDAGTGVGGALPELVNLVRDKGRGNGVLVAVDVDEQAVGAARTLVDDQGWTSVVDFRVADLRDVAQRAAATGERFDAVWSADVVWPTTFDDPAAVVRTLAEALAPGGTLALFTANYYQSMLLPGHSRLERLIRTASELTWSLPDDGPIHYERSGAWLRQAGLENVTLQVFPLSACVHEPAARAYLEQIAWPEMRHAVASHGRAAGMSREDVARAEALLDPAGEDWIGADPDAFVVLPMLLWTGRAGWPSMASVSARRDRSAP
ncbi:class I SAM-dependent methyltransferase [Streptomyces olivaceus]|uniref:class I SAM-dependent methyltransferase n=1 Tax=Streptomyces olivaceus TaxID=47716 RepID=UPI0037A515CF